MRGKQFVVCGGVLFLAGCGLFGPEEVVSDPDGPSSQAIMAEEIKTAGFSYDTQVESYDVHIEGKLQPTQKQPLTVAFQLSGTVNNAEDTFRLDGDIQIENQTDEPQSVMLLSSLEGEAAEKYLVEVEPHQTIEKDVTITELEMEADCGLPSENIQDTDHIQLMDNSHFSDRVLDSFQAISNHATIEEKTAEETTIRYTGKIREHFEEAFAAYWFNPYEIEENSELDFEVVVNAETMNASELVLTHELEENAAPAAEFRLEFSNATEGTSE